MGKKLDGLKKKLSFYTFKKKLARAPGCLAAISLYIKRFCQVVIFAPLPATKFWVASMLV